MKEVYIVAPCRTAIGSFGGALKDIKSTELGALVIKEVLKRSGVKAETIDQVLLGCVLQANLGQNPARQAQLGAGIPVEIPALTLNRVCGSGLTAIIMAAAMIRAGEGDCYIAGGIENMTQAPYYLPKMRQGARMGGAEAVDGMVFDGLTDIFNQYHMGITAENVAEKYRVSRTDQDSFAAASQEKAAKARTTGKFKEEIVPVEIPRRKADPFIFDEDEYIKPDSTAEKLAKLKPAFKKDGTVTAGNASGINDGAAAMLVVSEDYLKEHGLKPMARYVAGATVGVDPAIMGIAPIYAIPKAAQKANVTLDDIGLFEVNEAFAAQSVAVCRELQLPEEKVNVNGGAVALGHPIGASGARIAVTLFHEMQKSDTKYGVASLCIGGGMGDAAVFERNALCE